MIEKKIIEYKLVTDYSVDELSKKVMEMLNQGWQPSESAFFYSYPGPGSSTIIHKGFVQAMVKYE